MPETLKIILSALFLIVEIAVNASTALFLVFGTFALRDIANSLKKKEDSDNV